MSDTPPEWVWKLLPWLALREDWDSFQHWLAGGEAERILPSALYGELMWLESGHDFALTSVYGRTREILRGLAQLFREPGFRPCPYSDAAIRALPLDADYRDSLSALLHRFYLRFERCAAESDDGALLYYSRLLSDYTDRLYNHIMHGDPLPALPVFPPDAP